MKFTLTRRVLIALAMSLGTHWAWAAPQWCQGLITEVLIYKTGDVTVFAGWRGDYITVCNLNADRQGASGTACKGYLALIQQAIAMNRSMVFMYDDLPGACNAVALYHDAPTPQYVRILQN